MKPLQILVFALFVCLFFSCGKSDKKLAFDRVKLAESLCLQGDTITALAHLDSIRKKYPTAIKAIVTADQQKKKIYSEIVFRKQTKLDSVKVQIAAISKRFNAEKTEFDKYTQYTHKRQTFDRRWDKSFIQFHLDEKGNLCMSSNYYGDKWLKHVAIRVYDRDIDAKTDTIKLDDPNNHRSDFMDYVWEKVTYRNGKDNGVIQFIADHPDRKLKAVFLGKRYFYIWLEDYDKQAARDVLKFSALLKSKQALEKDIKSLQSKI